MLELRTGWPQAALKFTPLLSHPAGRQLGRKSLLGAIQAKLLPKGNERASARLIEGLKAFERLNHPRFLGELICCAHADALNPITPANRTNVRLVIP